MGLIPRAFFRFSSSREFREFRPVARIMGHMYSKNNVERPGGHTEQLGGSDGAGWPITTVGLRAAKAVARDEGVSDVTIWRRVKRGWLTAVNISGRPYITTESLAMFYRRAGAGEFSKPPTGAAGASSRARVAKEASV